MKPLGRMKYLKVAITCFVVIFVIYGAFKIGYLALKVRASKEFFAATTASCPKEILQWYQINGYDPGQIKGQIWLNAGVKQKGFSVDLSDAGKDFYTYSKVGDLSVRHHFSLEQAPECNLSIRQVANQHGDMYMSVNYQYSDYLYQMNGPAVGFKKMLLKNNWLGVKEEDFDILLKSDGHVILIEDLDFNVPVVKQRDLEES
jgi:hypothetical protein